MTEKLFVPIPHQNALAGVWIQKVGDNRHHVGLNYRFEGRYRHLHLKWHHQLADDEGPLDNCPNFAFYAPLSKSPEEQAVIAAFLSIVKEQAGQVPYGIDWESAEAAIQPDGSMVTLPLGKGLSCATFVASVLNAAGYKLVDSGTWPERPSDEEWQKWIVEMMEKTGVEKSHVDYVREDIGSKRLRPEEAAGACTGDIWPVEFASAEMIAKRVLDDMAAFAT